MRRLAFSRPGLALLIAGLAVPFGGLVAPRAHAQTAAPERYADVRVSAPVGGGRVAERLAAAGVGVDHAAPEKAADGSPVLRTVLSATDVARARAAGLRVDVLADDLAARTAARASLGGCPTPPAPITGTMACYPTFAETVAILDQMRAEFPALVSARTQIGTTGEGRPLWMIEVGDNPGVDEGEPEVLFTALHHAREPQSLSTVLLTLWDLLRRGDPEAQFLLANRRLFVVPVLNPDGYVYNQTTNPDGGGFWRKNRRANGGGSFGVDPNRNYGYEWGHDDSGSSPFPDGETYRGPGPFSEPETAALRDFVNGRRIRVALNYHAYSSVLIYPWGYQPDFYTPDSAAFVDAARAMTAESGYGYGTTNQTLSYLVNGSSDDWMYGDSATRPAILAFTPEVGRSDDGFWPDPSRLVPIAQENIAANRFAMRIAGAAPAASIVSVVDNGGVTNGFADPGELTVLTLRLSNLGRAPAMVTYARLVSTNPGLVTIPNTGWGVVTLGPGASAVVEGQPLRIGTAVPLGDAAGLALEVTLSDGSVQTLPLGPVRIGTPEALLTDDASSLTGWTAAGGWGRSTTVFVSAPSSFADSPTGDYTDNTDRTLTRTATVDLTGATAASLRFRARWDIEPSYDAATVEVQAGGGPWTALAGPSTRAASGQGPVPAGTPVYEGTQTTWQAEQIDLGAYVGQAAVRLRFRLRSDGFQTGDGFYVDDVVVERLVNGGTVAEETGAGAAPAVALDAPAPNPASGLVRLPFTLAAASEADVSVYDALGRRVAVLHAGLAAAGWSVAEWDATRVAPGVYVVRLRTAAGEASRRVVVR